MLYSALAARDVAHRPGSSAQRLRALKQPPAAASWRSSSEAPVLLLVHVDTDVEVRRRFRNPWASSAFSAPSGHAADIAHEGQPPASLLSAAMLWESKSSSRRGSLCVATSRACLPQGLAVASPRGASRGVKGLVCADAPRRSASELPGGCFERHGRSDRALDEGLRHGTSDRVDGPPA